MSDDRRQHQRFSLRIPVAVLGETTVPRSRDLSETGLFIELREPKPIGSPLPLRLVHPTTGEAIPAIGKVIRHVFAPDGSFVGVGLRFAGHDDLLTNRVRALLTELATTASQPTRRSEDEDVAYAGTLDGAPAEDAPLRLSFRGVDVSSETAADYQNPANLEALAAQIVDPFSADEGIDVNLDDLTDADSQAILDASATLPMVWPDTVPVLVLGGERGQLSPTENRVLAFIDGNNPVEQVARGAGLSLETTLAEVARLAGRGLVLVPDPVASALPPRAATTRPRPSQRRQLGLWDEARACVTEALAAERAGRCRDAARLLERALTVHPPNAADIHVRLALMGLGALADLDFAEQHARAAAAFSGDRPQIRRLLRAVRTQRARGRPDPTAATGPAPTPGAPRRNTLDLTTKSRRRFTAAAATLCILVVGAYNSWRYTAPWRHGPEPVEARLVAELVPAIGVVLSRNRLVVTVGDRGRWVGLDSKQARVERLAAWAQTSFGVNEVLVADATPMLLARAVNGRATVYR